MEIMCRLTAVLNFRIEVVTCLEGIIGTERRTKISSIGVVVSSQGPFDFHWSTLAATLCQLLRRADEPCVPPLAAGKVEGDHAVVHARLEKVRGRQEQCVKVETIMAGLKTSLRLPRCIPDVVRCKSSPQIVLTGHHDRAPRGLSFGPEHL